MRIDNYHHMQAPIEAPDNSVAIAAEAEYIGNAIKEARRHLGDAEIAAGAENARRAKQAIRSAMDCLSDLVED